MLSLTYKVSHKYAMNIVYYHYSKSKFTSDIIFKIIFYENVCLKLKFSSSCNNPIKVSLIESLSQFIDDDA